MSKAFGQVTSVLSVAERGNAGSYTTAYSLSPRTFTEEVEYQAKNRDLDTMFTLYARVYGRWAYLASNVRTVLYGVRTKQETAELERLLKYITQLTRAIEQVGTSTARNRLSVMNQAIREMVLEELEQTRQLRQKQPQTLSEGVQGQAQHFYEPLQAGSERFLVETTYASPATERFARVYARMYYLMKKQQAGGLTKGEDAELTRLTHATGQLAAQVMGPPNNYSHDAWAALVAGIKAFVDTRSAQTAPPPVGGPPQPQPGEDVNARGGCSREDERAFILHGRGTNESYDADRLAADGWSYEELLRLDHKYRCRRLYLLRTAQKDGLTGAERAEATELFRRRNNIRDELARREREGGVSAKVTETTRFAPGEVQGEFLLPGGSTLTAEQSRLKRLREYADTLTGEAQKRATDFIKFYTSIYSPSDNSGRWSTVPNDYRYVATMMCPKPDPLGRFMLCDIVFSPIGSTRVRVYLAGTMKKSAGGLVSGAEGLLLGDGYSENHLERIGGEPYARSHTPGGVIIKGVGLGTVLYSAHALGAAVYRNAAGCYSDGGSPQANAWWARAIEDGFALGDEAREPDERDHCESISDRYTDDGGHIVDDEVCATVTVEYDSSGIRYLPYGNVLESHLVVFGVTKPGDKFATSVQFPVGQQHRPFWDTFNVPTGQGDEVRNAGIFLEDGGPYNRTTPSGPLKMDLSAETAEMLARSFHGQSPVLAASIIEALTQSGFDDLAVNYATRADIAPLLAGNPTLKRLLESRRLPGVAGLSNIRYTKLMKAVGLAGLGQATVDMGEKNPLGFKPLSDKTKRLLAKFKDMD